MNKFLKVTGIVSLSVMAMALIVVVQGAAAQGPGPSTPGSGNGAGQVRRGNGPGRGLGVMAVDEADMHAALAEALGMTVEDFEAVLAEGKTPYTLALELSVDFADVQAAMREVHAAALEQATAEGLITQEKADWMLGRQAGRYNGAGSTAPGTGNMGRGYENMARGWANQGGFGGYGGDCPYETP